MVVMVVWGREGEGKGSGGREAREREEEEERDWAGLGKAAEGWGLEGLGLGVVGC